MTHLSSKLESKRIKWPAANKAPLGKPECRPEENAMGDDHRKLQAITAITANLASERFGEEQGRGVRGHYMMTRREAKIHNIRQELKALKHQYKQAGEEKSRSGPANMHPEEEDLGSTSSRVEPAIPS